jgi:hypothetical protein
VLRDTGDAWFHYRKQVAVMKKDIQPTWEALEIVPDANSCVASHSCEGHRFLCADTPTLPLPGCTSSKCTCTYKYYEDRRNGPRRAEDAGEFAMLLSGPETERRARRGRRKTDGQNNIG